MRTLSLETTKLLDKMYNLRGKDSVILVEMDKQKNKSEDTLESTTVRKGELQEEISNLETQHENLESQGFKLKEVLSKIDKNDFNIVLESLNIEFDPENLVAKLDENLPKTVDKVLSEMKRANEELIDVESQMNNAITTIEEIGLRKDTALANQAKLNEYFDLALNGKINITRDSITSLLEQFDFTIEEQREAAKILMFPEDALYDYDNKVSTSDVAGKSISDVIAEAKAEIETSSSESTDFNIEDNTIDFTINDLVSESTSFKTDDFNSTDDISDIITNMNEEIDSINNGADDFDQEIEFEPILFEETEEDVSSFEPVEVDNEEKIIFNPFVIEDNRLNEESDTEAIEKNLEEVLNSIGLDYLDFMSHDLDNLKQNMDKETFAKNVQFMKEKNIDLDIFSDNATLLYDKELNQKVEMLLNLGKEPIDIYLNPSILVKYTTEKLNNAIALLASNGMDPKNVPLMAY